MLAVSEDPATNELSGVKTVPFSQTIKAEALVACGRSCCVCNRYCGVRIECHHIVPESQGGDDSFENCIPLCFDCHAEVEHYNPQHPKGNKFSPVELRGHRDRWYQQRRALDEPEGNTIDPDDMLYIQRYIEEQKQADFIRGFNGDDWK